MMADGEEENEEERKKKKASGQLRQEPSVDKERYFFLAIWLLISVISY
jgi:hypothetical protein